MLLFLTYKHGSRCSVRQACGSSSESIKDRVMKSLLGVSRWSLITKLSQVVTACIRKQNSAFLERLNYEPELNLEHCTGCEACCVTSTPLMNLLIHQWI